MQAEDGAEREKSAKDGEDSAPPAGAEAGGAGIAKECVDFLFERGVTQFRSSSWCSDSASNGERGRLPAHAGARMEQV
jgi:hypothetical protein